MDSTPVATTAANAVTICDVFVFDGFSAETVVGGFATDATGPVRVLRTLGARIETWVVTANIY